MARPMQTKFTGLHRLSFELTDDGIPGPPNIYNITIVFGLYDSSLVAV